MDCTICANETSPGKCVLTRAGTPDGRHSGNATARKELTFARPFLRPRETALIAHLKGREKALEAFGWTGRRAEWIALACLQRRRLHPLAVDELPGLPPEKVRRAVLALVAQGLAVEEVPAAGIHGIGRVCRIHARRVYRALGAEEFFRRRRITSVRC